LAINIFAINEVKSIPFFSTKRAEISIQKALTVHQFFTSDYDIMKYLKGSPTYEEKNLT